MIRKTVVKEFVDELLNSFNRLCIAILSSIWTLHHQHLDGLLIFDHCEDEVEKCLEDANRQDQPEIESHGDQHLHIIQQSKNKEQKAYTKLSSNRFATHFLDLRIFLRHL